MKELFVKVRISEKGGSVKNKILMTTVIMLFGFWLGLLQKWIDGSVANYFPVWLQIIDIRNCFGRLAIWILLGTVISVYSKSPLRAAINTFLFFISMLSGYYLYCNYVLGFLPKTYMMMWIAISFPAFFSCIYVLVCKRRGNNCDCNISYHYWGTVCTGIFNYAGILCVSFCGDYYLDACHCCFKKKTQGTYYGTGGIIYHCISLSVDYAALGISSNKFTECSRESKQKLQYEEN